MSVNNNPNNPVNQQYTTQKTTTTHNEEQEQIRVTRELDGLNDTGIIGELLTNGTENLSDANKYFSMTKFAVTGLLAEDNQAVSTAANLSKVEGDPNCDVACADDMYVAGDPGVGGKGNNYAFNEVTVKPGFYTMFEDGKEGGPKITVNSHADKINPEGKTAFTEYGFVVQDPNGTKTKATLSGGVFTIIGADGSTKKLLPGEEYTVGNTTPPTAKFYYADAPGAGKDGASEKRLMVDYYEKPSPEAIDKLVAQGVKKEDAEKLLNKTTLSYGFRTPDGKDTFGMPEGVGSGAALKNLPNGVKTYYDSHYTEGSCTLLDVARCGCEPPPPPPPPECPPDEPPTAANEHGRIWGDPHIEDADGGKYDFHEKGMFNVLKDKGISLNSKTVGGPDRTTVIAESGLTIGGRTVLVQPNGKVTIGYADPSITTPPVTLANNQTVMLDNGYSITRRGNDVTVDSTSGEYKLLFDTDQSYKGYKYMDIDIWSKAGGVLSDGQAPSGLVGETFDADKNKQTNIKNNAGAYSVNSLLNQTTPTTTNTGTTTGTGNTGSTGTNTNTGTTTGSTGGNTGTNTNTGNTTGSTGGNTGTNTNTGGTNGNTTTTPPANTNTPTAPPTWTGDMNTYLPQVIAWLMQLLGMKN